jgi:vacuolar-type H+-ATPase subunit F/Vma7
MLDESEGQRTTQLHFLGDRALAEGFALIGFEVKPDATPGQLDKLLQELLRERENAFIVIDQKLAAAGSRLLPRVYDEGGRIVVLEVPPLAEPEGFRLDIDEQVQSLLGGKKLEE